MHFDFDPASPTIWVFLSVIIFFAALVHFGIHKKVAGSLDERSEKIRSELDEARRLREEAQTLLASYQRKQKEAEEQAEHIIKQARKDAEAMAEQARKDLKDRLDRRAALAEAKIANAEAQALADVKAKAAQVAIETASKLLENNMTTANHTALVKKGIDSLPGTLS